MGWLNGAVFFNPPSETTRPERIQGLQWSRRNAPVPAYDGAERSPVGVEHPPHSTAAGMDGPAWTAAYLELEEGRRRALGRAQKVTKGSPLLHSCLSQYDYGLIIQVDASYVSFCML